jgi:menaquinol-cytochrome c reductase iron-sulfur subunit
MKDVRATSELVEPVKTTRRGFYTAAIYGLWGIMTAALGLPALMYLFVPPRLRRQSDWVDAGDISQLETGNPVEMTFRRNRVDGWKVTSEKSTAWVVKLPSNKVVAYAPQCTHLGCAYHWDQEKDEFICPCHNSVFSMEGKVLDGPAPRPLDRFQSRIEGSQLQLGPLRQAEPTA